MQLLYSFIFKSPLTPLIKDMCMVSPASQENANGCQVQSLVCSKVPIFPLRWSAAPAHQEDVLQRLNKVPPNKQTKKRINVFPLRKSHRSHLHPSESHAGLLLANLICFSALPGSGELYSEVRPPCRVMILVNPHSGRGQALQLFSSHVQGMLTEAAVPYTLVITGRWRSCTNPKRRSVSS